MYYNASSYDSRQKFGHDHLGKYSYGKGKEIYQYKNSLQEEDDELDEFVNDVDNDKINGKIGMSGKIKISDFLRGRQDNAGPAKNYPLDEYAGNHRNPIRKGISPYKQPKHSGPPLGTGSASQAFKTTGNYRRTGTHFGYSRPHKLLTNVEDENIFNLEDMLQPLDRSFKRQQNRIKNLFEIINNHRL
tara:strand:- start:153 stop:716 length:564 start_codon:yes stop_codon:yes gene_type:complete